MQPQNLKYPRIFYGHVSAYIPLFFPSSIHPRHPSIPSFFSPIHRLCIHQITHPFSHPLPTIHPSTSLTHPLPTYPTPTVPAHRSINSPTPFRRDTPPFDPTATPHWTLHHKSQAGSSGWHRRKISTGIIDFFASFWLMMPTLQPPIRLYRHEPAHNDCKNYTAPSDIGCNSYTFVGRMLSPKSGS